MVTQENNDRINSKPTKNELQEVVFSMNHNTTVGPDGFNGYFFQKYWHINNQNLMEVVLAFSVALISPSIFHILV